MAKFKSLLVGTQVVNAGKARKCYHNPAKHRLQKGDTLIELRDGMAWKGYCVECAGVMLDEAESEIRRLRQELGL